MSSILNPSAIQKRNLRQFIRPRCEAQRREFIFIVTAHRQLTDISSCKSFFFNVAPECPGEWENSGRILVEKHRPIIWKLRHAQRFRILNNVIPFLAHLFASIDKMTGSYSAEDVPLLRRYRVLVDHLVDLPCEDLG